MKKYTKQGFTLIELLIVIAIIGILAGVILVSTNSARQKGNLATLKATFSSLQSGIAMCCTSSDPVLVNISGNDLCNTIVGANLPGGASNKIGGSGTAAYAIAANCNNPTLVPGYTVTVTDAALPSTCTGSNTWTVDMTKVKAPSSCTL